MRTIPRVITSLAVCSVLASTAALAQDSYDIRRHANFSGIRTYAFKVIPSAAPLEEQTTTYNSPIMVERTNDAIARQLEARGIKRDDEHPDVYVVTRRTYYTEYYYYGPYGWGWWPYPWAGYGPYYGTAWNGWGDVYSELRGTLTVDVEDAKTGALLWRGVETKHVHETSKPSSRDRRVAEEVADVFKHFPTTGAVGTAGVR